jgi:hypothetical protein
LHFILERFDFRKSLTLIIALLIAASIRWRLRHWEAVPAAAFIFFRRL